MVLFKLLFKICFCERLFDRSKHVGLWFMFMDISLRINNWWPTVSGIFNGFVVCSEGQDYLHCLYTVSCHIFSFCSFPFINVLDHSIWQQSASLAISFGVSPSFCRLSLIASWTIVNFFFYIFNQRHETHFSAFEMIKMQYCVCVCACLCICVCAYLCTYTCVHTCIPVCVYKTFKLYIVSSISTISFLCLDLFPGLSQVYMP